MTLTYAQRIDEAFALFGATLPHRDTLQQLGPEAKAAALAVHFAQRGEDGRAATFAALAIAIRRETHPAAAVAPDKLMALERRQ